MIKKRADHVEPYRPHQSERNVALRAYFGPPHGASHDLDHDHGDGRRNPADGCEIKTRRQIGQVDFRERKIKQARRDQYFEGRKQKAAHVTVVFGKNDLGHLPAQ